MRRVAEIREGHLRRKFGLTQAGYDALLEAQGGGCAVCGEKPTEGKSFHVDHLGDDVRGILCVRCNNALGQIKESAELASTLRITSTRVASSLATSTRCGSSSAIGRRHCGRLERPQVG